MKISDQLLRHPFRYGTAAIAVLLGFFFLSFRRSDISSTVAEWGQFGDYMGGLLNPLFGLISIVLIAATLRSQTQAAKLQAFEHQFFTLLSMHASVLQSIDRQTSNKKTNVTTIRYGRDCFYLFYRNIIAISQRDRVPLTTAYQRFLKINGWEVEHYFRTVYHLFKHVKDQSTEIEATATQRKRYYDLIKSQLSQYELVLLWLNVEGLNRGNWDAILNDPEAKPFEHLNKANLVEDPPQVPSSEAADLKVM